MIVHYDGPCEGTIAERAAAVAAWCAQRSAGRAAPPAPAGQPARYAPVSPREWWGLQSGYEHTAGERQRGLR